MDSEYAFLQSSNGNKYTATKLLKSFRVSSTKFHRRKQVLTTASLMNPFLLILISKSQDERSTPRFERDSINIFATFSLADCYRLHYLIIRTSNPYEQETGWCRSDFPSVPSLMLNFFNGILLYSLVDVRFTWIAWKSNI